MDYSNTFNILSQTALRPWLDDLPGQISKNLRTAKWKDLEWNGFLTRLPKISSSGHDLNSSCIRIGHAEDGDATSLPILEEVLQRLQPWRKGPFEIFGIGVDGEWRSDMKWDRLKDYIAPLKGRTVLDIGCGNGYHGWRMVGEGAQLVVGIEPVIVYVMQFQAIRHYIDSAHFNVLPIGVEDLPDHLNFFDTVFSMGLLYHRRDPLEHLDQLKNCLREGGEVILETLIIDGAEGEVLYPKERYAQMRNVYNLPSILTVESWLRKAGFTQIRCVNVTPTTSQEQRTTPWMPFESLDKFLDPQNSQLTIEGYPAPKRAIFLAQR